MLSCFTHLRMTKKDKAEMAIMIAEALKNLAPAPAVATQEPETATESLFKPENVPVVVTSTEKPLAAAQSQPVEVVPTTNFDQIADLFNDTRVEVRIRKNMPIVEALKELFKNPVASAVVNGKKELLISGSQMAMMLDHLKKTGKYWPEAVVSALNENGERQYLNSSYKRAEGDKWKVGPILVFADKQ